MTPAEIALMRALVHYRRSIGATYWPDSSRYDTRHQRASVAWYAPDDSTPSEVGFTPNLPTTAYQWVRVATFTEAVDVLVAFDYLPARFSSAYRKGYDAGYEVCGEEVWCTDEVTDERIPAVLA